MRFHSTYWQHEPFLLFRRVEVLPFDTELVLREDFGEIYDDDDDSNGEYTAQ